MATVECPGCSQMLDVDAGMGTLATCPMCGMRFDARTRAPATLPAQSPAVLSTGAVLEAPWQVATPDGQTYGPTSAEEIIGWIQQGRVGSGAFVWRQGMGQWQPIELTAPFIQYVPSGRRERRTDEAYCSNCGAVISRDAVVCVGCGVATARGTGKLAAGLATSALNWPVVAGSAIVVISFFLPWVDFGIFSIAGYQIPSKVTALASAFSKGDQEAVGVLLPLYLLYLIPLLGIDPIFTQATKSPGRRGHAIVCSISIFVILTINFWRLFMNNSSDGPSPFNFMAIGFYGTFFGALAMLVGSVLVGAKKLRSSF